MDGRYWKHKGGRIKLPLVKRRRVAQKKATAGIRARDSFYEYRVLDRLEKEEFINSFLI